MAADKLEREILDFLAGYNVVPLATSGQEGVHCASLFYANDDFTLHWVSDPASRHSHELQDDSRIAATIAPEYDAYTDIRGLQIAGVCGGDKLDHGSGGFSFRGRSKTLPPVAFGPFWDGRWKDVHRGSLFTCSAGLPC
jgi:hypothetical protein